MPKYLVTSGSHFDPFRYDDLVKPVAALQQAHDQAHDVYDALEMDTAALGRYISSEEGSGDEEARKIYDSYMRKLKTLQDELYQNGYTAKTKRNLSDARKSYASDITRLSKAVEARQNRSAEYWKYKHEHPDMIMGADPGLSGLDNYLNNDGYGQNYYQYSGAQFENEVAEDAKARAREVFSAPEYRKNPALAGYIQRIDREGFSDSEISSAIDAIRNGGEQNLSITSKILYDVLKSHLDSTGARDLVTDDEYDRLINYGRSGLSRAIGGFDFKDIQDREWVDPNQSTIGKKGSKDDETPLLPGYTLNNPISSFQSPGYREAAKSRSKQNRKYQDGPKMLIHPNDTSDNIESAEEMTSYVYNPDVRRESRKLFGGLDIALTPKELEKQTENNPVQYDFGNGQLLSIKAKANKEGGVDIYYNSPSGYKYDKNLSDDFNSRMQKYKVHVDSYKAKNDNIGNFQKYAISPAEEQKIREKYKIPAIVDTDDVFAIEAMKERVATASEAPLLSSNYGTEAERITLGNNIYETYQKGVTHNGGKIAKDSKYAFYPVQEGGLGKSTVKKDAINKLENVFEDGKVADNLMSISFTPEDVAQGTGDGRPFFRFISKSVAGEYTADAEMLGTTVWNKLKSPVDELPYSGITMCDAVDLMMQPILNPQDAMAWTPEQDEEWVSIATAMLNGMNLERYGMTGYLSGPMKTENGRPDNRNAEDIVKDIIRDPQMRDKLYRDITQYITEQLSPDADNMQKNHPQHTGASSTDAPTYLPNI